MAFLKQLLEFSPKRVVYVSCDPSTQVRRFAVSIGTNTTLSLCTLTTHTYIKHTHFRARAHPHPHPHPHTLQARDSATLIGEGNYTVLDCTPFDMFPQTKHVENVMVFEKV